MTSIDQFLLDHHHELINDGISGAEVYSIGENLILKRAQKSKMKGEGLYDTFKKEVKFYHYAMESDLKFVPKIISFFESNSNDEIGLLMNRYKPITVSDVCSKKEIIQNIFTTLGQLHSLPVPSEDILPLSKCGLVNLSPSDIQSYSDGWKSVLNEHPDIKWNDLPPSAVIEKISLNINEINKRFYIQKLTLIHGDFHLCNCLTDDNGQIFLCDWQNVSLGNIASDLSFFLSRLSADGVKITEDEAISMYLKNLPNNVNKNSMKKEILNSMNLAELNTSFMFWHEYLHNCEKERVSRVFCKMVDSWNSLNSSE